MSLVLETGMTFSEKLKELRLLKGISVKELVERSGLPRGTIDQYFMGRRDPSALNLFKLAQALGVTCDDFRECTSSVEEYKGTGKPGRPPVKRRKRPSS